jgi:hypothetical protein
MISGCVYEFEKLPEAVRALGEKKRESHIAKKSGRHLPLLVTVNEPWRNRADVCACADEQEDDEQEGLEVEQRRLRWSTGAWESRQSGLKRKYVERHRPWCVVVTAFTGLAQVVSRVVNIYLFYLLIGVIGSTCSKRRRHCICI